MTDNRAQRWLVLLRGVNVSGTGKLPMAQLRAVLADDGFDDVATYIQTGNVRVSSALDRAAIEARMEAILRDHFALDRPAMALTAAELEQALAQNPFPQAAAAPTTLHLVFLKGLDGVDMDGLAPYCDKGEEVALIGNVFFLYTPNGAGKSRVANRYEKHIRAAAVTARNLNSCRKLLDFMQGE